MHTPTFTYIKDFRSEINRLRSPDSKKLTFASEFSWKKYSMDKIFDSPWLLDFDFYFVGFSTKKKIRKGRKISLVFISNALHVYTTVFTFCLAPTLSRCWEAGWPFASQSWLVFWSYRVYIYVNIYIYMHDIRVKPRSVIPISKSETRSRTLSFVRFLYAEKKKVIVSTFFFLSSFIYYGA